MNEQALSRSLSCGLVLGAIAMAVPSVHCGKTVECTMADCSSNVTIELHVKRTVEELAGASVRLCHGESCGEKLSSQSFGQPTPTAFAVERRSDGWSTVRIRPRLTSTDYLPDGDRYMGEIRDGKGELLLAFDRGLIYDHVAPNGESCGPRCSNGTLIGYPESGKTAACTGHSCTSGARFEFLAPMRYGHLLTALKQGQIEACRNALCSLSHSNEVSLRELTFEGDLVGVTLDAELVDDNTSRVVLTFADLPVLLTPGDRYSFSYAPQGTPRVVLFEQTVATYDERWPNGDGCDLYPCRTIGSTDGGL